MIPVKPLGAALGRLGEALGAEERRALQAAMLADLLRAVAAVPGVGRTLVVTADPDAARLARAEGAGTVADHVPPRGMNAAVRLGARALAAAGAGAALILMADLPLARAGRPGGGAGRRPAGAGRDAGALARRDRHQRPAGAPARRRSPRASGRARWPATGPARRAGACAPPLLERPALGLDVDTPEDLAAYLAGAPPGATREVCVDAGPVRAPGRGGAPLRLWTLPGLPEVRPGDDLDGLLAEAAARRGHGRRRRPGGGPQGGEQGRGPGGGPGRGAPGRRGPGPGRRDAARTRACAR